MAQARAASDAARFDQPLREQEDQYRALVKSSNWA